MGHFFDMNPKPEIWVSMCQVYDDKPWGDWWLRTSYQVDEWLIGGAMPKSRVLEVFPCRGNTIIYGDESGHGVVTEYYKNIKHRWDCKLTVWRRAEENERSCNEVISIEEKPRKRSCYEIEERCISESSAHSQQVCYKKRKYKEDSRTSIKLGRDSNIKLLAERQKDVDKQAEAELVESWEEESKDDLALGSKREFEAASDKRRARSVRGEENGLVRRARGHDQDQNEMIVIEY